MATEKNITMKQFNGTDYDILYPKTKVIQIDGFDDSIAKIVPVGSIYWYTSETIPDGFLLCDGSNIGRTDYASLFAVIGTVFGAGDGSTTFTLPDLRAAFIRGAGSQDGYSATFANKQNATMLRYYGNYLWLGSDYENQKSDSSSNIAVQNTPGSSETGSFRVRPYNIALTPIIKY